MFNYMKFPWTSLHGSEKLADEKNWTDAERQGLGKGSHLGVASVTGVLDI